MNDGQKKEMAVELTVPQAEEEEETVNKQSTTILEQVRQGPPPSPPQKSLFSPFNLVLSNCCVLLMLNVYTSFCRPCAELRMRRTLWQPLRPKRSR